MDSRLTVQLRAVGGFAMNLSVAMFSLGVVAPLIEVGVAANQEVSFWVPAVMTFLGLAFLALGIYVIGWAEVLRKAPET